MKKNHPVMLLLLSAIILLGGCSKNNDKHLVLTGSSTIAPLATVIAQRYEEQHPDSKIDVQTGGSSRGTHDARTGMADIGMASRALHSDEKRDLQSYMIARDGISIIINKANPVNALSNKQIVDIYTGKIKNWQQVGGADAAISVINKAEGHSTLELFLHFFKIKNSAVKADVIIGDNQQGIKTVAGNPNAIGYVSIGTAEYEVNQGTKIKLLPIQGVKASIATVANGSFPLARPLNLVTKGAAQGQAKAFIDFAHSKQVNDLIRSQYFVPLQH